MVLEPRDGRLLVAMNAQLSQNSLKSSEAAERPNRECSGALVDDVIIIFKSVNFAASNEMLRQ